MSFEVNQMLFIYFELIDSLSFLNIKIWKVTSINLFINV